MIKKYISVIVPCYNEERYIKQNIEKLYMYLSENFEKFEIIAVNDGSKDNTLEKLKNIKYPESVYKILDNGINRGKGYSVKRGILSASGDIVCFTDADLSTPVEEIGVAAKLIEDADIVIGSRRGSNSRVEKDQPLYRKIIGKIFSYIRNIITNLPFEDTQCGFKCFTKQSTNDIFPRQTIDRFAFDVEILYIARKLGYTIKSFPVKWVNDEVSSVNIVRDSIVMFMDLLKIRKKHAKLDITDRRV